MKARNHGVHRFLVEGVPVEHQRPDGSLGGDLIRALDHDEPGNNGFLAVNQFRVAENQRGRRPDIVLFVNGLLLAVIELKNAAAENATVWSAFQQLQTYKRDIPSLFAGSEALVISDGVQARVGTLTAERERFCRGGRSRAKRWRIRGCRNCALCWKGRSRSGCAWT